MAPKAKLAKPKARGLAASRRAAPTAAAAPADPAPTEEDASAALTWTDLYSLRAHGLSLILHPAALGAPGTPWAFLMDPFLFARQAELFKPLEGAEQGQDPGVIWRSVLHGVEQASAGETGTERQGLKEHLQAVALGWLGFTFYAPSSEADEGRPAKKRKTEQASGSTSATTVEDNDEPTDPATWFARSEALFAAALESSLAGTSTRFRGLVQLDHLTLRLCRLARSLDEAGASGLSEEEEEEARALVKEAAESALHIWREFALPSGPGDDPSEGLVLSAAVASGDAAGADAEGAADEEVSAETPPVERDWAVFVARITDLVSLLPPPSDEAGDSVEKVLEQLAFPRLSAYPASASGRLKGVEIVHLSTHLDASLALAERAVTLVEQSELEAGEVKVAAFPLVAETHVGGPTNEGSQEEKEIWKARERTREAVRLAEELLGLLKEWVEGIEGEEDEGEKETREKVEQGVLEKSKEAHLYALAVCCMTDETEVEDAAAWEERVAELGKLLGDDDEEGEDE